MASTIQVDKIQDTGGNTIISSNSTGTFTSNLPAVAPNVSTATGTLAIAQGGTGAATFAAAGLSNTPNCLVYLSGSQTITDDTITKITFDTEVYDSDSAFASNKFTVPAGKAGKYAIFLNLSLNAEADSNMNYAYGYIYKNGSNIRSAGIDFRANPGRRNFVSVFSVEDLAVSDYIEAYAIIDDTSGSPTVSGGSSNLLFMIYKLI